MVKKKVRSIWFENISRLSIFIIAILLISATYGVAAALRLTYVYDNANILTPYYKSVIDKYLRDVDAATSAEIIIYTIPSFVGHGIIKDGHEINDRDLLANYIFNEVPLDGIKGIGKQGKNNGVLVLYSLKSDSGGGSMRIEVGRGLEGEITDGTAGQILDSYLVPAREIYQKTGNRTLLSDALLKTVIAIGQNIGYSSNSSIYQLNRPSQNGNEDFGLIVLPLIFIAIIAVMAFFGRRRRWGWYGGMLGWGTGWSGGGSSGGGGFASGGGGSSGGGGAGR
jgi:uncharacterized protein